MKTFMDTLVPERLVQTVTLREALLKTSHAVVDGSIIAFEGSSGLGKTTSSAYVCRETSHKVHWKYAKLPYRRGLPEVINELYRVLLGEDAPDSMKLRQRGYLIVQRLAEPDIGLVIDEAQRAFLPGLQLARDYHDEVATMTGRGFPMILAGIGLTRHIQNEDEVIGRISSWTYFTKLEEDAIIDFARAKHPRLALTDPELIMRLSEIADGQTLRGWTHVIAKIDKLPSDAQSPTPLSKKDIGKIERMRR